MKLKRIGILLFSTLLLTGCSLADLTGSPESNQVVNTSEPVVIHASQEVVEESEPKLKRNLQEYIDSYSVSSKDVHLSSNQKLTQYFDKNGSLLLEISNEQNTSVYDIRFYFENTMYFIRSYTSSDDFDLADFLIEYKSNELIRRFTSEKSPTKEWLCSFNESNVLEGINSLEDTVTIIHDSDSTTVKLQANEYGVSEEWTYDSNKLLLSNKGNNDYSSWNTTLTYDVNGLIKSSSTEYSGAFDSYSEVYDYNSDGTVKDSYCYNEIVDDFDMNGISETAKIVYTKDKDAYETTASLSIEGANYSATIETPLYNLNVLNVGSRKYIMVYDAGPSDDYSTLFLSYENGRIIKKGVIDGMITDKDVTSEGMIYALVREDYIESSYVGRYWLPDENGMLVEVPLPEYDLFGSDTKTLLYNLPIYDKPNGTPTIISPQPVKTTKVTADGQWIYIESAQGNGYMHIEPFGKILDLGMDSTEVFEGLSMFG